MSWTFIGRHTAVTTSTRTATFVPTTTTPTSRFASLRPFGCWSRASFTAKPATTTPALTESPTSEDGPDPTRPRCTRFLSTLTNSVTRPTTTTTLADFSMPAHNTTRGLRRRLVCEYRGGAAGMAITAMPQHISENPVMHLRSAHCSDLNPPAIV